jgi:eukaryotic-like serine/threonine-protein kinase
MTPERYRQIGQLYHAALEVNADARAAFLERACAGDAELRREVESLIESHEQVGNFIDVPALSVTAALLADRDALPGQTIAHYRIESLIGTGGMGRVYVAEDTRLGRRVALKLLPEFLTHDDNLLQRFRQEARTASALNHPNILTIHEIGQTDDLHFIATEFIDGETLRDRMTKTRMNADEVLDVATQVASALDAAHAAGIVHRDIKPENIMLRRDGIAKVLDFGLAKLANPDPSIIKTIPGMVMGTAAYMSPEQARGHDVDARTDIWSFGVVLYEMLTGKLPFAGETASDVIAAILTTQPVALAQLPADLHRITRKCLEKNREERYQTAKDLLVDLRQLQKRPAPNKTLRNLAAIGIVALLIAFASVFIYRRSRSADMHMDSLAVMPFVNDSHDPQADYLSDGITESLIDRLSQSANLKVMSRNSVFRFKGSPMDAQQVSKALDVRAVMMGHLKRIDNQLVIGVELIDARDGSVIWTHQYVRKMADVIAVQANVARDIAENLRLKLSGAQQEQLAKRYTDNVEAYQLYLKGRYLWNRRKAGDFPKSREFFQRAIDLDSNFALPYVGLALSYNMQTLYEEVPSKESIPNAKAAVMKALELDDTVADAHSALGWIRMVYEWDRPGAEREFQRALELNPNDAYAHHLYGAHLVAIGRFDEGIAKRKTSVELDPLSAVLRANLGWTLYFARRYDEAIAECREALALEENFFRAHLYIGLSFEQKGMFDQAIAEFMKALSISPANVETLASLAHVYAVSGHKHEAEQILSKLNELSKQRHVDPYFVALVHLGLGQKDQAFEFLEKAVEGRSIMFLWFKIEPRLDPIRSDARYAKILRRVGFSG